MGILGQPPCALRIIRCRSHFGWVGPQPGSQERWHGCGMGGIHLSAAGQRLQDALTFQQRGLRTASTGVETENRVRLVQGLLLTGAGLWRAGQAIVAGRQSSC